MKTHFSELNIEEAISVLTELGDGQAVSDLTDALDENPNLAGKKLTEIPDNIELESAKWKGTEHAYGYIQVDNGPDDYYDIDPANTITADETLKGQQVNIKLGSLYTMNYPGWGRHNVLMHFKCKHANQEGNDTSLIEFEQKFKSKEGEGAGNLGDFIFLGLRVPSNGLQFMVQTVNVSNDGDEKALEILEGEEIKNGLDLVNASFATLAPFTKMAQGVLNLLLTSNRNKIVQDFTIGFDFDSTVASMARLKTGTYVVAQVKRDDLNWNDWVYKKSAGLVVHKDDSSVRLPYNHLSFNVTRYSAD